MASIICQVHGGSGVRLCCEHVLNSIHSNQHINTNEIDGGFMLGQVWICDNCLGKIETLGDTWVDMLQPACGKCASAWVVGASVLLNHVACQLDVNTDSGFPCVKLNREQPKI